MDATTSVLDRYTAAARAAEPALCCPVRYDPALLAAIPDEVVERDYGCGDPSPFVRPGDTVLDLGSGGGKVAFIAAQLVGEGGRVIGVDMNDEMLDLARRNQGEVARRIGGDRVRFVKGMIQDLALDVAEMEAHLRDHPVRDAAGLAELAAWQARQRAERPLIPDASVDLVVSNCVLNLVDDREKAAMVREIHRVLRPGGRVAVSDIVADEAVPAALKADPALWSGCISGAFEERAFLRAFVEAGFLCVAYDGWEAEPWRVVEGIEFRSVVLTAVKGAGTPCLDVGQSVIYRGPFAEVTDDEGHVFPRGERMAVCERTFRFLTEGPLRDAFIGVSPATPREGVPWCAPAGTVRPAAETKGAVHVAACCAPGCC